MTMLNDHDYAEGKKLVILKFQKLTLTIFEIIILSSFGFSTIQLKRD